MIRRAALSAVLICAALPSGALDLNLPANARQTMERNSKLDSYAAPFGPFENGRIDAKLIEGEVRRSAWRIASPGLTTLQVLMPLRAQLLDDGYDIVLDCDQMTCGGFDFRFQTEVLPAPSMYVNIRAYRFVLGVRGEGAVPQQVVGILVSSSATASHVQVIEAGELDGTTRKISTDNAVPTATKPDLLDAPLESVLLSKGSVVLRGLEFETGTSDLGEGSLVALKALADFMKSRGDIRIALVGHTDSVGSLEGNIALSRKRAASVRAQLIDEYGIAPDRVDAEGMGYLAPVASNLEQAGREANRRVEAVILPK